MNNYNNNKEQLINIIKEKGIADIILSDKKDMEIVQCQKLYKQWRQEKRKLEISLKEAKENIILLEIEIKKNCKHTNVTEEISPGWERASHDYCCNQCGFYIQIHKEFDYKNITKVVNY
jgi:hypothetical protein